MMDELGKAPGKNVRMDVSKSGEEGMAFAGWVGVVRVAVDRPMDVKIVERGVRIRASRAETTLSIELEFEFDGVKP